MKLELENYKTKYTVEKDHEDVSIEDYLDIFIGLLTQAGWHRKTIDDAIIELSESLKEDNYETNT